MTNIDLGLSHPKLSISAIIPVYNGEKYLGEAINSILTQTYPISEIIVMDDGSTDQTAEVVKTFPSIRYYYQTNQGSAVARNEAIKLAKGNYLAFLDADDLWLPNKLELQVKTFQQNSEIEMVSGYVQQFISPELSETIKQEISCPQQPMVGTLMSALLIKKQAFFKVGEFDVNTVVGEFMDWYKRAMDLKIQIVMLPDTIMKRRIHKTNKGIKQRQQAISEYLMIVRKSIAQKRNLNQ
ncbi:glycosyltransferase family A protein [Crocosphaera sp.]|uniref:glycosyltransferase family A protein n=1 Tax=Crocosphaera sp. TaxID=2729996 RepID=UPI002604EC1A|nr:glycosyltransferase family A protein [Crocosphaera sp.]MDJ0581300.1 glycosyltransferase family A protein [Crocosphaera sp.]